jgi:hypothetical protein
MVKIQGSNNNGKRRIRESRKKRRMISHAALAPDTKVNSVKNTEMMNVKLKTISAGQVAFMIAVLDILARHGLILERSIKSKKGLLLHST